MSPSWLVASLLLLFIPAVSSHWNYVEDNDETTVVLTPTGTFWRDQAKERLKYTISNEYDPEQAEQKTGMPFIHALRLYGIIYAMSQTVFIFFLFMEEVEDMDISTDVDDKMMLQIVDLPKRVVAKAVRGVELKSEEVVKEVKKEKKRRRTRHSREEVKHRQKRTRRERRKSSVRRRKLSKEEVQLRTAEEKSEKRLKTSRELELELTPRDKTPTKSLDVTEKKERLRTKESKPPPMVRRVASRIPKSVTTEKPMTAKLPTPKSKVEQRSTRLPRAPKGNQTKFLAEMEDFFMGAEAEGIEAQPKKNSDAAPVTTKDEAHAASPEKSEKKQNRTDEQDNDTDGNDKQDSGEA